jgi:hypothetical protein
MKIKWVLCKADDLATLKADLRGHTTLIEILLLTTTMKHSPMQGQQQEHHHFSLAASIQDMSFQWMAKLSTMASTMTRSFRQSMDITAEVLRSNVRVLHATMRLQKDIMQVPGHIRHEEPVKLLRC